VLAITVNNVQSIRSLIQNIAKYLDYVKIIAVFKQFARYIFDSEDDLSVFRNLNVSNKEIEVKQLNLERQHAQSCAYMTAKFKHVLLSLNFSTLWVGM